MPAFVSHYIHAKSVEEKIKELNPSLKFSEAAYNYGAQGPDFLFSHKVWLTLIGGENLGELASALHSCNTSEFFATAKERKAILNNARIEIAMIIGCSGIVFWMMNDFTQAGIMSVLLGSMVGNIILAYCILMLLYAVWTVAIDRH